MGGFLQRVKADVCRGTSRYMAGGSGCEPGGRMQDTDGCMQGAGSGWVFAGGMKADAYKQGDRWVYDRGQVGACRGTGGGRCM